MNIANVNVGHNGPDIRNLVQLYGRQSAELYKVNAVLATAGMSPVHTGDSVRRLHCLCSVEITIGRHLTDPFTS